MKEGGVLWRRQDREALEKHLKLSLELMQTDYIDLYQFGGLQPGEAGV